MPPYITTPLSPSLSPCSPPLSPSSYPRRIVTHQQVIFRWHHSSAKTVFLTGEFDGWAVSIPLPRDPACYDEFAITLSLDRTRSWAFKFVVDGEWRCSTTFPTIYDEHGNVNNCLEALTMDKLAEMTLEAFGRRRSMSWPLSGGSDDDVWVPPKLAFSA
ncbi:hypothetical protein SpCBS45565_g03383 [Spizellomyces sp. 'palustris']|nr:hypothetical protein SpCBS45565_g03383 [Spizellomyces sp. 'palustris']